MATAILKKRKGIPDKRPLTDFLPTISIKAKDFAAEMTSINVQAKDLQNEIVSVRNILPIILPYVKCLCNEELFLKTSLLSEYVKKVEQRLNHEDKNAIENKNKN